MSNKQARTSQRTTRSIGTQTTTVGIHGDSNYDTLTKNSIGLKSVPFSSTPTTSTGRNLRRNSSNTTTNSNDSSVEVPKDNMPNLTEIRKSHLHGKSTLSNLTDNNSKSKSHVNSRLASNLDQDQSSNSKMPREKLIRFYIDENEDETDNESAMAQPNPSQHTNDPVLLGTRLHESNTSRPAHTRESILSKRKHLSLSVGGKTRTSQRVSDKAKTRSLNRLNEIILNFEDPQENQHISSQPTTSARNEEEEEEAEAEAVAHNNSKRKRGKSSLIITKRNKNSKQNRQELSPPAADHQTREDYNHFDYQEHAPSPTQANHEETNLRNPNNLNDNSIFTNEHDSIEYMNVDLVEPGIPSSQRRLIKRPASQRAQRRIMNIRQMIDELDASIRNLREFDHLTSNVRRSERLRLKHLKRQMIARMDLNDQLRREEDARDEYEREIVPKRSKKSQPINSQFITLRRNNEGYSGQQKKVKAQRGAQKNRKKALPRMVE
jgi:hypothetical protein